MYKCKDIVLLELNSTIYLIMQINIYNRIGHQAMTILVQGSKLQLIIQFHLNYIKIIVTEYKFII